MLVPNKLGKVVSQCDTKYLSTNSDIVVDLSQSQYFFIDGLDRNTNLHICNPKDGCLYRIGIKQNTVGGFSVSSWVFTNHLGIYSTIDTTIIKWRNQQPPVLSLSASIMDRIDFWYVNGVYYGQLADNF